MSKCISQVHDSTTSIEHKCHCMNYVLSQVTQENTCQIYIQVNMIDVKAKFSTINKDKKIHIHVQNIWNFVT